MIISIFYQKFELNAMIFNDANIMLNEDDAIHIMSYHINRLKYMLDKLGISRPAEYASMEDVADSCFKLFNINPTEAVKKQENFKKIGHTSMSVGDYVTIQDGYADTETIFVCQKNGWKKIEHFSSQKRIVLEKIKHLPIDTISRMYETLKTDNCNNTSIFTQILNFFKDTRCENHCPKCGAKDDDITWSMKDISGNIAYQNAYCLKCKCAFTEEYEYVRTCIDETV